MFKVRVKTMLRFTNETEILSSIAKRNLQNSH